MIADLLWEIRQFIANKVENFKWWRLEMRCKHDEKDIDFYRLTASKVPKYTYYKACHDCGKIWWLSKEEFERMKIETGKKEIVR